MPIGGPENTSFLLLEYTTVGLSLAAQPRTSFSFRLENMSFLLLEYTTVGLSLAAKTLDVMLEAPRVLFAGLPPLLKGRNKMGLVPRTSFLRSLMVPAHSR